jgi:hypothetical protein
MALERSKQIIKRADEYDAYYANFTRASRNIINDLSLFTYKEDIKAEFEASPKLLLEIEQFTDEQMANIVKEIGVLLRASYWVALREAVEKELMKR